MLALCWSTVCDGGPTLNQHYSGQRLVFVGLFDHADPEKSVSHGKNDLLFYFNLVRYC